MDCSEARRRILGGEAGGDDLARHLADCPACAALAEDDGALARWLEDVERPPGVPGDLLAAVQQDLAGERGPRAGLRALTTPVRVALVLAAGLAVVGVGVLKLRPDLGVYPLWRLALELATLALLGAGAAWLWLRPLHRPGLPRWVPAALLALALILPWVLSALPAAHVGHPASLAGTGDDFVGRALACFLYGSLLGLPLALLAALLGRGGRRLARWVVLPAAAGGVAGLISLHLHCPLTSPAHLLAGHAPIVLVVVGMAVVAHMAARR